ncbi:MAG: hypothetical protein JWM58_4265 [Rhizobium sp.]|nr:hypothetical protein [Rhizobium sp.]
MITVGREEHWQKVYTTKADNEVSWYEEYPAFSLDLISKYGGQAVESVVDVGGGASRLVDELLKRGTAGVCVVDVSSEALAVAKSRLPADAPVEWVVTDVTTWRPRRRYDLWHDRAAFHFLTNPSDQKAYVHVMDEALRPGGTSVIGTFSLRGPEKCSGLEIVRHDGSSLSEIFGNRFTLVESLEHQHVTPWNSSQAFQFSIFRKSL